MAQAEPYRTTRVFDEDSLPTALRAEQGTRAGTWGLIRILEGEALFVLSDPPSMQVLKPGHPGLVAPGQLHYVEPLGPMHMQVEFYDAPPEGAAWLGLLTAPPRAVPYSGR